MKGLPSWGYPALSMALFFVLWHAAVVFFEIPPYLVPRPLPVFFYLVEHAGFLAFHTAVTAYETVGGFVLSVVIGVPLAMALVGSRTLDRAVMPLLVLSQTFPKIALAPLLIIWFGIGVQTTVLVSFLIAFFPILMSTVIGMRSVESDMIDLGRSMRASPWRIFTVVRLPYAMPSILSGMKVAIAFAVVGAVVGEWVGANSGLGFLLLRANANLDTVLLFAILVILMLLGAVLYGLLVLLERMLIPWHISVRSDRLLIAT
jgi:NitT/TauT family transport system permease protein